MSFGRNYMHWSWPVLFVIFLAPLRPVFSQEFNFREPLKVRIRPAYIDPEVVFEFERRFSTRIEFRHYNSDEARDSEMAASDGQGQDVILVSGFQIEKYAQRGFFPDYIH